MRSAAWRRAPHANLVALVTFKRPGYAGATVALENADAGVTCNVVRPGTIEPPANRKPCLTPIFRNV